LGHSAATLVGNVAARIEEDRMKCFCAQLISYLFIVAFAPILGFAGEAKLPSTAEWNRTVEAANKEGKIVAGIPASAELRKTLGDAFKARFPAIELEITNARGPSNAGPPTRAYILRGPFLRRKDPIKILSPVPTRARLERFVNLAVRAEEVTSAD
jgi:hypothetical protein